MRQADMEIYLSHFPVWADRIRGDVATVCALSANVEQVRLMVDLFPRAQIISLDRKDWDLDEPGLRHFDLIVAMNVFMYSRDPARWFKNVLGACRYFWMQDVIRSRRGDDSELGGDGDSMRFCLPPNERADMVGAYDLTDLRERISEFVPYYAPSPARSFLLSVMGDL